MNNSNTGKIIVVKPNEGRVIRWPDTKRVLKNEGEMVPDNTFWRRRILEGDVLEIEKANGGNQ